MSKHIVKYYESERGWGGEVWFRGFETIEEANAAIHDCNKDNTASSTPDYYIIASYEGIQDKVPQGWKH